MRFVLIHDMSPGIKSSERECWLDLDRVVAVRRSLRQLRIDSDELSEMSVLETDSGRAYVVNMKVKYAIEMVKNAERRAK
jgi:hypothetical protein